MNPAVTILRLDGYLSPGLNKWQRLHWGQRAREKARAANYIRTAMIMVDVPDLEISGTVKVLYLRIRRRGRDMDHDNLHGSFKPIGDALEDIGVVSNDADIILTADQRTVREGEEWGSVLTFTPIQMLSGEQASQP